MGGFYLRRGAQCQSAASHSCVLCTIVVGWFLFPGILYLHVVQQPVASQLLVFRGVVLQLMTTTPPWT